MILTDTMDILLESKIYTAVQLYLCSPSGPVTISPPLAFLQQAGLGMFTRPTMPCGITILAASTLAAVPAADGQVV